MNKLINGKRYDTKTARQILPVVQSVDNLSNEVIQQTFYMKRNGELFYHKKHHPSGEENLAVTDTNTLAAYIDLVKADARPEENVLSGASVQLLTATVKSKDSNAKKPMSFYLDEGIADKLEEVANKRGVSKSTLLSDILYGYLYEEPDFINIMVSNPLIANYPLITTYPAIFKETSSDWKEMAIQLKIEKQCDSMYADAMKLDDKATRVLTGKTKDELTPECFKEMVTKDIKQINFYD